MTTWSGAAARNKLLDVMQATGLQFSEMKMYADERDRRTIWSKPTDGVRLTQHKKTWQRKRESAYLIRIEYIWEGKTIFSRTEPWVSFPSDELTAKMMLLPVKVTKEVSQ